MDATYAAEVAKWSPERSKPMNPEVKEKWLAALRSGEYSQGKGVLRHASTEKWEYCCLGVLCDVYDPDGWTSEEAYNGITGSLSDSLAGLVGIQTDIGSVPVTSSLLEKFPKLEKKHVDVGNYVYLTELNDCYGWTFGEIADLIEYAF